MVIGTNMSPQLSSFQNPPPFNKSMGSTSPPSTSTYLHSPASGNASRSSKSWSPIRPISSWRWFLTLVVFSLGRTKMERSPNSQPHKKMKRASTWSNTISTWHAGMIRKKKKTWLNFIWLAFFITSFHPDSQVIAASKFPFDPAAPCTWLHFSRCNSFMGVFKAAWDPDLPNVYPRLRRICLWGKISKDLPMGYYIESVSECLVMTHITANLISSQCPKVAIQDPNRLPWRST